MRRFVSILLVVFLWAGAAFGETAPAAPAATPARAAGAPDPNSPFPEDLPQTNDPSVAAQLRNQLLQRLARKLLNHKGQPVSVVVFTPIDFTTNQTGRVVSDTIVRSLKRYGNLDVKMENYILENLTLSEFRKGMAEFKVDVLVATSLRNTNFDIYIYDRRTPFFIYAHSEPIPEMTQLSVTEEVAEYYGRVVLRRALYRYINDQYFELPREDSAPVLQSEIPRWIASPESIQQINRQFTSDMYASVSTGVNLTKGPGKDFWNSSLLGLQLGYRLSDNFFGEFGYTHSAYHTFNLLGRYLLVNRGSPYQIGLGLGASFSTARKNIFNDPTLGLGLDAVMGAASVSLLFPLGDVHLKVETQAFMGLGDGKLMFTVAPGILLHF